MCVGVGAAGSDVAAVVVVDAVAALGVHAAVAVVVVLVAAVVVVPVYGDAAAVVTVRRLFASINCVFSSEEQMLLSQSLFLHHKVAFWKSYESKQNWVLCSKSEGACLANHLL